MNKYYGCCFLIIPIPFLLIILWYFLLPKEPETKPQSTSRVKVDNNKSAIADTNSVKAEQISVPESKVLDGGSHTFQTFNNCGPAALSMALSFYGINITQAELGNELRPYQIPNGDNDDKSVTLEELANKSTDYNLVPFHRPNGNLDIITKFITIDIPVITRTWLKPDDDIGHYRVIKGFNKSNETILQDDSLQGKNLTYTKNEFDDIWDKFNYEYLVLVPESKLSEAKIILGNSYDEQSAWNESVTILEQKNKGYEMDATTLFNLSVAYHKVGRYHDSINAFEKVETRLNKRALWYQIEPINSYYEVGNYSRVFEISENILNNENKAYSELYLIRGNIYAKQNKFEHAKSEYEKAIYYNKNYDQAKDALKYLPQ